MDFQEFCKQYDIKGLNPQQEKAVQRVNGATLLLAVPGSGKTTVIVARTGYMLHAAGVHPENILTLTYTKAAALEMQERFVKKFQWTGTDGPYFSTINAFCLSIIRTCAREKDIFVPRLVPNNEKVVRDLLASCLPEYPSDSSVKQMCQQIGKAKNEMLSGTELQAVTNPDTDFADFFHAYNLCLQDNGLMDFDDQLLMAYSLLQSFPDILERARARYRYISLDEAQDTSLVQHKIVQMLVGKDGNIFMVGDEDQSIYGFRGAYPYALLDFQQQYNNAEILYMETNYRSDKTIVDTANRFIKRNASRNDKNMRAMSVNVGDIRMVYVEQTRDMVDLLVSEIQDHYASHPEETMAVLYRNNDSAVALTDMLMTYSIPFRERDALGSFFSHFLIADMMDLLRFAMNPRDLELFCRRLYYKMGWYLAKRSLPFVEDAWSDCPERTILQAMASSRSFYRLRSDLRCADDTFRSMAKAPPAKAIELAMQGLSYWDSYAVKKTEGSDTTLRTFLRKVNILKMLASRYKTIPDFLDAVARLQNIQSDPSATVTLSTIHSSKGLEFDKVIMIDVLDGVLPASNPNMTADDMEEEARLFYVGATRAKHELKFITPRKSYDLPLEKSEFLLAFEGEVGNREEAHEVTARKVEAMEKRQNDQKVVPVMGAKPAIPEASDNNADKTIFHEGDRVAHSLFGTGLVRLIQNNIMVIDFAEAGEKRMSLPFCQSSNVIRVVS